MGKHRGTTTGVVLPAWQVHYHGTLKGEGVSQHGFRDQWLKEQSFIVDAGAK